MQQKAVKTGWPSHVVRRGWTSNELTKESQSFDFTPKLQAILRDLAKAISSRTTDYTTVTREQFSHPVLDPFLARMVEELRWGKGLTFLRGIPVDDLSIEELRIVHWGIGTHLGVALSQSGIGDRMGDVMAKPGSKHRGYTSDQELELHTDYTEVGALLCVQPAKTGGVNMFSSSLKLWDIVETEHPEFMPVLLRGFRNWREGEYREGQEPITPYYVPVFGEKDGLRSVYRSWITAGATHEYLGEPLGKLETDAIKFIYDVFERPEMQFEAALERGEIVFFNNFEVFHARSSFEQFEDPAKTRHLMRLWLESSPPRAVPDKMKYFENESGHLGHDPDPARRGQPYITWHESPVTDFMKAYFEASLTGKQRERDLVVSRLENA